MNRKTRRGMKAASKIIKASSADVTAALAVRMAQVGPAIRNDLVAAVEGEYKPGHAIDAAMKASAQLEEALLQGDSEHALNSAACILFLVRDIAITKGVITVQEKPTN